MISLAALLLLQPSPAVHEAAQRVMGSGTSSFRSAEAAPPPPMPACLDGYLILFDWASDEISAQAQAVLDNAVTMYQLCPQSRLTITGHTDRSGSDRYNARLSQRRAAKVRAYLAGRGIPDRAMNAMGLGESRPRVETADGDRELQNRRVEIIFGLGSGR